MDQGLLKFSKWLIPASEIEWYKNKILGTGSYGTVYKGKEKNDLFKDKTNTK
jgi:hypothetical protein